MATKTRSKAASKSSSTRKKSGGNEGNADLLAGVASRVNGRISKDVDATSPDIGAFARVTKGEHQGRYGVIEYAASVDAKGLPKKVVFRTRDDESARLVLNYKDLEAAKAGGR